MVGCGFPPRPQFAEETPMMTRTEMEDVLRNLDRRVERIEQILPTLATKEDLKAFATKEDLKAFATKEDLKAFATKDDLQAYPTKDDLREALRKYATKDDLRAGLQEVMAHTRMLYEQTREDIQLLATHVADISQRLPPRS
jgi:hypothetical protein